MRHGSLSGFFAAWALTFGVIAVHYLAAALRLRIGRRAADRSGAPDPKPDLEERMSLLFGLLMGAVAAYDGAFAVTYATGHPAGALAVATGAKIAAVAFLVHLTVVYARVQADRIVAIAYGVAAILELTHVLAGAFHDGRGTTVGVAEVFGVPLPYVRASITTPEVLYAAASASGVLAAATLLARAFIDGRAGGMSAFFGISLLCATVIHDSFRILAGRPGPELAPYGWAAVALGAFMTLLARNAWTRRKLQARWRELRARSQELARSFRELRAAQSEIVKKEQLAAVGELSAVVAHEVRNPLAIITNAVASLRRDGLGAADRATLLGILDEETSRLNRLVGDLLTYAKPVRVDRQLLPVRELVERACAIARDRRDIVVELEEREPVGEIWGDPVLLRQVVDNLVSNALQAMAGGGGTLAVSLARATVDGIPGVTITVEDTGEGMDTTVRKRALDAFFTTRPSGTGLGLAIVARVVDAHGGRLRIESAAGAGTLVEVFLPVGNERPNLRLSSAADVDRPSTLPPMPVELRRALARAASAIAPGPGKAG